MRITSHFWAIVLGLLLPTMVTMGQAPAVGMWNSAALLAVRDSKLGAPMASRALAIVHTCMYDAWAAYDAHAVGTQLAGALRRPPSERTLANKKKAISYAGQPCASSTCYGASSSSSPVYATLVTPSGVSVTPTPMTVIKLGVGAGGGTTQSAAFANTWNSFAGPANARGWDGRLLYYYQLGVPFSGCATTTVGLLTQPNGSGQCASWARLMQDSLAANGISSNFVTISLPSNWGMLVKNWSFSGSPSFPTNAPWIYLFKPVAEASGALGMVPPAANSIYGDFTSLTGVPGQNSPTPFEKFFGSHYIVKAPANLSVGGPYFDPSYGVTYAGKCDFESKAVAAYVQWIPQSNNYYGELPSGSCVAQLNP